MIPETQEATREELLAEINRLDARERSLQAQRRDTTYRLQQVVGERERLKRHLASLTGEEVAV